MLLARGRQETDTAFEMIFDSTRITLNRTLGRACAALALAVAMTAAMVLPSTAEDLAVQHSDVLARANASLNDMQSVSGDFIQVGPSGERAEGKFYLLRPGKLRFEYNAPSNLQIIADGFWVAIQDRKLKTTEKYPLATTPLKLILARNVDLSRDAHVRDVHVQEGFVTVTLEARSVDAVGSLILIFDSESYDLRQWTVTDAQGLDTSIALTNLTSTDALERKLFRIIEDNTIDVHRGGR